MQGQEPAEQIVVAREIENDYLYHIRIMVTVHSKAEFGCCNYNLFAVTAAGVVLCGSPKKRPRTSSIVQFIFFFWSFEISENILRNQKLL